MSWPSQASDPSAEADRAYPRRVLGIVMLGTMMSGLDASIVNVSLPNMMTSLGASIDEIEWVVTGYMLAFSTFMPMTAWLRDRLGYRTLFVGSLGIFTLGSVLCGVAPNLPFLVLARAIQALGGGAMTPTGMAMIAEVFPPAERGRALGIWGLGVTLGPALGPTAGGYLTDAFGWRSIFNVNLPIGMVALLLASRILRPDRDRARVDGSFDLAGFVLLSLFLGAFQLGLAKGNHEGWTSPYIVACGLVSAIALILFATVETVATTPILDLALFKNPQYAVAIGVTGVRSVALYGGSFLLPLFLQNQMGRTEVETGLLLLPGALVIGVVMPIAGRLVEKVGPRVPTLTGLGLTGWFMWTYRHLDVSTSVLHVFYPTLIRGVGLGLLVTPLMTVAINAVPTRKAGAASSVLSLVQQVSGSLGIAVLASVLERRATFHLSVIGQSLGAAAHPPLADAIRALTTRAQSLGEAPGEAARIARAAVLSTVAGRAEVLAFDDAFLVGAGVVLAGLVPAFLLAGAPSGRRAPLPHHE